MITDADLRHLDDEVSLALRAQDARALCLLGFGEVSLVLGWPPEEPKVACKRLPPFRGRERFESYADAVHRYLDALGDGGVHVVDTEVRHIERDDGAVIGYHVQPLVPADALGTEVLRSTRPDADHPLLGAITDAVVRITSDCLGIDAQLSNWAWADGIASQLDLTTPMMLDADGEPGFEFDPFLRSVPAVVRPATRREMRKFMTRYLSPHTCLVDFVSNISKEGLSNWVPAVLDAVNRRVEPPITVQEAEAFHAHDIRLWPLVLRLQRAEAWWQRTVRRRTYEFLLREHSTYETSR